LDGSSDPILIDVPAKIKDLRGPLASLVEAVHDLAPNARIALVGYPDVMNSSAWDLENALHPACVGMSPDEFRWVDEQVIHLNSVLSETAAAASTGDINAVYVDIRSVYDGHEACVLDSILGEPEWINSVEVGLGCGACDDLNVAIAGSFHPNEYGHALAGPVMADALQG
jgi:hypothetical protein